MGTKTARKSEFLQCRAHAIDQRADTSGRIEERKGLAKADIVQLSERTQLTHWLEDPSQLTWVGDGVE